MADTWQLADRRKDRMNVEFLYEGRLFSFDLKDKRIANFPESGKTIATDRSADGCLVIRVDGMIKRAFVASDSDRIYVDIDGSLFEFALPREDADSAEGLGGGASDPSRVLAPMPGKIVKLQVEVGEEVKVKQHLVIIEAMKMENQLVSQAAGKVKAINFTEGDQVDTETPIIELDVD
jgi:biotin carboxyl carrier protein